MMMMWKAGDEVVVSQYGRGRIKAILIKEA
jgi:RNA polymerase-interacting CarD/CdnL/TRCF family regulator